MPQYQEVIGPNPAWHCHLSFTLVWLHSAPKGPSLKKSSQKLVIGHGCGTMVEHVAHYREVVGTIPAWPWGFSSSLIFYFPLSMEWP